MRNPPVSSHKQQRRAAKTLGARHDDLQPPLTDAADRRLRFHSRRRVFTPSREQMHRRRSAADGKTRSQTKGKNMTRTWRRSAAARGPACSRVSRHFGGSG